jgi:ribonucleoside-diphosphate reductase alpha chain
MYEEDHMPGEVFIKMSKEGSTLSGVMDGVALSISIGLQYGVPLKALVDKLMNTRFEPAGFTQNPDIRYASSVLDYIARWLGGKFISIDYLKNQSGDLLAASPAPASPAVVAAVSPVTVMVSDATVAPGRSRSALEGAPTCSECGMLMTPNGGCYKCSNCGSTSGCS